MSVLRRGSRGSCGVGRGRRVGGCTVDGKAHPEGESHGPGARRHRPFRQADVECQVLTPAQIGKAVGAPVGSPGSTVRSVGGPRSGVADDDHLQLVRKGLGHGRAAQPPRRWVTRPRTSRSTAARRSPRPSPTATSAASRPRRPAAGSPHVVRRDARTAVGRPCDGPTKLMELVLKASA